MNSKPAMNAWVMMMRAAFSLFSDRRMLAMTELPMPNIRPSPVAIMNMGATMFTAAMPSAPTPFPTKMPSMMFSAELKIMPTRVGKNRDRNSGPILLLPKSSLSLSRCLSFAMESCFFADWMCKGRIFCRLRMGMPGVA